MRESRHEVRRSRSIALALPDRLPLQSMTMVVGTGVMLLGSAGTHSTGGRLAPLLSARPYTAEAPLERRRQLAVPASSALASIRLWTGLAWGTIGDMLGVSRKAVHNWASGDEPIEENRANLIDLYYNSEGLWERLGQHGAGLALSAQFGVPARASRASPRQLPSTGSPLLENDRSLIASQLKVVGTRPRGRQTV